MSIEIKYMKMAFTLAAAVKGTTFPNPAVGAVIVKDGEILGRGATRPAGFDHAEIVALKEAKDKSKGADLYVSLEPCSHFGKTPPCTDAIIKAGIKKVVLSSTDPNPIVSGSGIQKLEEAGIEVISGILEDDSLRLNEEFFFAVRSKLCWVTLKLALTLDGSIADDDNISKWITTERSRTEVHKLRAEHAAIAVGKGTYQTDDPKLTVRDIEGVSPVRVLFMKESDIKTDSYFFKNASEVRSIIVSPESNPGSIKKLETGIEVWGTGNGDMRSRIIEFRKMAFNEGLTSVLVEGGAKLAASFLENDQVNKMALFYGNTILGGGVRGLSFTRCLPLNSAFRLDEMRTETLGENIMVTGYPRREI